MTTSDNVTNLQLLRRKRGIQIARTRRILQEDDGWLVGSQVSSRKYKVTLGDLSKCTCADYQLNGKNCKHIYAVQFYLRRNSVPKGKLPKGFEDTEHATRPTYPQNWQAYNAAQTNEEALFLILLSDLCKGVPRIVQKRGRPQVGLGDAIFASTYKVYSTLSGRRFMTALRDAHVKSLVSHPIHYNSISKQLCRDELTPVLTELIEKAGKPMSLIDENFAIDSTGIGTSRFVRWFSLKYNREQDNHDWVKLHVACGVITNVIAAVEISDRTKNDSPFLPSLIKTTRQNFKIVEVSADKGYTSRNNLMAIKAAGGEPYVMFKSHHTGKGTSSGKGEGTELWSKTWHFFHMEREAFLKKYHRRSNAETTFHMIKSKFGHSIRSRTDVSQVNESLCKVLCHNICVLIQAIFEYGVIPPFLISKLPKNVRETMLTTNTKR